MLALTVVCPYRVRAVVESDIVFMSQRWLQRKALACLKVEDETQTALSLNDLHGSFTVWAIGIACAIAGFFGELSVFYVTSACTREFRRRT